VLVKKGTDLARVVETGRRKRNYEKKTPKRDIRGGSMGKIKV